MSSPASLGRHARPNGRFAAAGIALVVTLLFAEAIFSRRIFFYRDIHAYWYPQVENVVRAVTEAGWPLWNPYAAFGAPLLADPSCQVGYPFTWLNLILQPAAYYKLLVLTHCLASGLGFHRLALALGLRPLSAFVGAAAWTSSGPLLSSVSMTHHFTGAAWMPWVLMAFLGVIDRPTVAASLGLGAAAAGQILAGSGDMCAMTALLGLVLGSTRLRRDALRAWGPAVVKAALISAPFALALSAVQWLPTFAILSFAARHHMGSEGSLFWSMHPLSLLDVLVPSLIAGFPMSQGWRAVLLESREPFLACLYLGVPAATLVFLAVCCGRGRSRLALALGFVLLVAAALGRHTPLSLVLLKLPLLGILRYPVKYMIPAALVWCLLLSKGIEWWHGPWSEPDRRRARWAPAFALALAVAGASLALATKSLASSEVVQVESGRSRQELLAPTSSKLAAVSALSLLSSLLLALRAGRPAPPPWLTAALTTLVIADLVSVGRGVNPLAPPELLQHRPPLLASVPPESRVFVFQYPSQRLVQQLRYGPAGWEGEWRFALGLQELLVPPIAARFRLYGSYDGDFTGLAPPVLSQLSQLVFRGESRPLGLRLLQLASVDSVLALQGRVFGGLPEVASYQSVFADPIRVFRVPAPLPRAHVVSGARVASGESALAALADPAFDPWREVVLAEPPSGMAEAPAGGRPPSGMAEAPAGGRPPSGMAEAPAGGEPALPSSPRDGFSGSVRILERRLDSMALLAELDAPGFVVISEAYDPGWRATVDGAAAELLRANVLFRAVPVAAGRHAVVLRYRPREALVGGAASAAAAHFGLAFAALRARPSR